MFTVTVGKVKVGVGVMLGVKVIVGVSVAAAVGVNVACGVKVKVGMFVSVGGAEVGVTACDGKPQARMASRQTR